MKDRIRSVRSRLNHYWYLLTDAGYRAHERYMRELSR